MSDGVYAAVAVSSSWPPEGRSVSLYKRDGAGLMMDGGLEDVDEVIAPDGDALDELQSATFGTGGDGPYEVSVDDGVVRIEEADG